jgi:hypothetical protein
MCQVHGEFVTIGQGESQTWDKIRTPDGVVGYLTDLAVRETWMPFDPRLPRCTAAHGGSVYYQPRFDLFDPKADADHVVPLDTWSDGNCSPARGGNFPDIKNEKLITTLSGWSLGRLGPTYLLSTNFDRVAANVDYIILFDPGSYGEYFDPTSCDGDFDQSDLYRRWLSVRPANRLLILAGAVTRDIDTAVGPYAHRGIQEALFPKIRGTHLAQQVLVCNYNDLGHADVLKKFRQIVQNGPQPTCPQRPDVTFNGPWHP